MKVFDIIKIIEKTAPLSLAASWDKSGLQVAAFRHEAAHVAVMLDPSLGNILKAKEMGADFLLSHHPLSMEPRYPDTLGAYHSILSTLLKADLPLYSAHTSLDANPLGPVRWLAAKLGLMHVRVLEVEGQDEVPGQTSSGLLDYGFGFVGDMPEAISYTAFSKKLAAYTHKQSWRACGPKVEIIKRVACCPGSGTGMIPLAQKVGADVFITGDLRYHAALDAEVHVIDIGHFQLEEIMMQEFAAILAKELAGTKVSFIAADDPLSFETA